MHGCSDPFWPDGLNLNLTRNHILAAVKELDSFGEDTTQIYIPPQVADWLMIAAGKHFEKRYERLKVSHKLVVEGEEISLF